MESTYINRVEKGWGYELIFANNDKYCGKILNFKEGGMTSLHFHKEKHETWYVHSGSFYYHEINTDNGDVRVIELKTGDSVVLRPFVIHRLCCREKGEIFEVSTHDDINDSYRVGMGDTQKKLL